MTTQTIRFLQHGAVRETGDVAAPRTVLQHPRETALGASRGGAGERSLKIQFLHTLDSRVFAVETPRAQLRRYTAVARPATPEAIPDAPGVTVAKQSAQPAPVN